MPNILDIAARSTRDEMAVKMCEAIVASRRDWSLQALAVAAHLIVGTAYELADAFIERKKEELEKSESA